MFRSTLRVMQGDNTSVQATTSTIFTPQEGKVTESAVHLHARTGVPEVILQPSGDTGSMLQIHPGTPRHACKYEKRSSSEQDHLLTTLVSHERWSQAPELYKVLPNLTNDPKS